MVPRVNIHHHNPERTDMDWFKNSSTTQNVVEIDTDQLALFSGAAVDANQLELFNT